VKDNEFKEGDKIEYIYGKGEAQERWIRGVITSALVKEKYESWHLIEIRDGREFSMDVKRIRHEEKIDFMKVMGAR